MTSDDPSLSHDRRRDADRGRQDRRPAARGRAAPASRLRRAGGGAGTTVGPLQQGTKQLLPVDRISFESTYSQTTGTFEPQLKLGKDLTDELSISLGQTFGVESRTLVEADYRLTPRVFIPLTWESQTSTQEGAFGAGVKVRYEFWRVTPYTLLQGWR